MPGTLPLAALLACILACLAGLPAHAQPAAVILQSGETSGNRIPGTSSNAPITGLDTVDELDDLHYLGNSDQIEAALCRGFGVTIIVVLRPGEHFPETLTARTRHPRLFRPDGASGEESSFTITGSDGQFFAGFTFDHVWEMQPGDWEIAFYDGDRRLAAKTFTVHRAPPGHPTSVCESAPLS